MNREDANLMIVAVEVSQSNHGDYLKHLAAAYVKADRENKALMKPFWEATVNKYGLELEYQQAIAEHQEEYLKEGF